MAFSRVEAEGDEQIAGVSDGGVGEQAFDVALQQRAEVADAHAGDGEELDQEDPVRAQRGHAVEEEAQQHGEGGGLGRGGHQADDRRGRALVDIRRPDVEGSERDLEAEADEHHRDGEDGEVRRGGGRDAVVDGGDGGGAGCAEAERDAVEEECGGEAAEQEVFERGLGGGGLAFAEARKDVGGDRRDLEADEDHEQLDGAGHEHHAGGAEERERVELAGVRVGRAVEVVERGEQSDEHDGRDEQVEEDGEVIDLDRAVERADGAPLELAE